MGYNPRVTKCELCSHRLEQGSEARLHDCVSDGGGDLWAAYGAAGGSKTAHQGKSGPLLREQGVRRDRQRRHAVALSVARSVRRSRAAGTRVRNRFRRRRLRWQRRFYQYFALPAVLYAGLVQVIRKSVKGHVEEAHDHEKETGLRAQL